MLSGGYDEWRSEFNISSESVLWMGIFLESMCYDNVMLVG